MIDLRSDTGTLPSSAMRQAMMNAELGDDGRTGEDGKGEDPTVVRLERTAATLLGKEDALFCPSGTMANVIAVLSFTKRGDLVALDRKSHLIVSEKSLFSPDLFGRTAVAIETNKTGVPNLDFLERLFKQQDVKLLCLENTNGYYGGNCLTVSQVNEICMLADRFQIPIHLDGARMWNAAVSLQCEASDLARPTDTVMFCLSKGLGAPVGSLLCGTKERIREARVLRKAIGGTMRQAGIMAAAGLVALENVDALREDHEKTTRFVQLLKPHPLFSVQSYPHPTNMVHMRIMDTKMNSEAVAHILKQKGLLVKAMSSDRLRLVFHQDISWREVEQAADIMNSSILTMK
ncbi:GntG family PLP-dependent aldolase [Sporosarcina sp. FSL W7-1349]|uniref:threonine aldolase family protein n=1 Tax=Sporosarcina sp. FSL W7-1349 TaxID=2921561 RepID=UPI0030F77200